MGLVFESAVPPASGVDPERLAALLREAGARAPALVEAAFLRDLDRPPPAPVRAPGTRRVVVLGIGGSALGARCVHEACGEGVLPLRVVDNIDPQAMAEAWRAGDPARTAWVIVSKSGSTTETLAQCALVRERLREISAWDAARVHVVTGARGPLCELARAEGLELHFIPEEVGGRFSVFTPAATVPLALAGHDVAALLAGARAARAHCVAPDSLAARLAALLVACEQAGRNVVACWAYAERLEPVGEWFRQLWAESLGKTRPDGSRAGQTPLCCVGSTDQHSIQQLIVEGPPDKAAVVLAGPATGSLAAPAVPAGAGAGHAFAVILDAMRRATSAGMVRAGCPLATLKLESWSEADLGRLLAVFACATVLAGGLLGVDPYGQPGVEAAKRATRELLEDPGGATEREIADLLGEGAGERCP